ncbi:MAG: type II toxin-antitoxin system RelE/ParE family toxin [Planctomycetota bacterium]
MYQLTATAEHDLEQILHYVAGRDGINRALHVHSKFTTAFETLTAMPQIGTLRPNLTGDVVRWHHVFRWAVLYDPQAKPLTILRIIHGAREIERILRPVH